MLSSLNSSAKKGLPLPLGRGVRETKSKNGRSRPRRPFISRVFCARRGDHGLRPWSRKGPDHGLRSGDCELKTSGYRYTSGKGRLRAHSEAQTPPCDEGRHTLILLPPYCAIPRDYLSDTPLLHAMGFLVSQHGQLGAIPPPPFLSVFPWRACEVEARYPPTTGVSQRYLCDTL